MRTALIVFLSVLLMSKMQPEVHSIINTSKGVLLIYFALLVLVQVPIWYFDYLPLQDYPNHLARMFIISGVQGDILLQNFYEVDFSVLPNLAMDVITPALVLFVPLDVAGRLTVVLAIVLLTSGCVFINFTLFKRLAYWPLTSFLIIFNKALVMGFLNFLIGIGVSLWLIGLWILIENKNRWFVLVLFNILGAVAFIVHLYFK